MAVQTFLMNGHLNALAITTGQRWSALENNQGESGLGDNNDNKSTFAQVGSLTTWQNTESNLNGPDNRLVVNSEGKLYAWGRNNSGVLGLGDTSERTSPVQVGSDTDWLEAAQVASASMAIKTNNTIWTWGDNASGQQGRGNTTSSQSPAQVGSDTDWAHVLGTGINNDFLLAMKLDGSIYYSGTGTGGLGNVTSFTQIGSEDGFKDVLMIGFGLVGFK